MFTASDVRPLEPLFWMPTDLACSASQLDVEPIPMSWAVQANFDWHSQLPEIGGLQFGDVQRAFAATYDGGVYGVAIWTRPLAGNRISHPTDHLVELRRLAIPEYAPRFTATRMLSRMARLLRVVEPTVCRLLSYQITDVHTGTIYKAANWHEARRQESHESWTTHSKRKALDQNAAPKVRWEYQIRKCGV